jgi:hypothetical protein
LGAKKNPIAENAMNKIPTITIDLYLNREPKAASISAVATDERAIKESSWATVPGGTWKVVEISTIVIGITISMTAATKTAESNATMNIILGKDDPFSVDVTVILH